MVLTLFIASFGAAEIVLKHVEHFEDENLSLNTEILPQVATSGPTRNVGPRGISSKSPEETRHLRTSNNRSNCNGCSENEGAEVNSTSTIIVSCIIVFSCCCVFSIGFLWHLMTKKQRNMQGRRVRRITADANVTVETITISRAELDRSLPAKLFSKHDNKYSCTE